MKRLLLLFLLFATLLSSVAAQSFDARLLRRINAPESQALTRFSKVASASVDVAPLLLPVSQLAYGWLAGDRTALQAGVRSTISLAVAVGVSQGMKYAVNRQRPYERYPDYIVARSHSSSPSFPSGHTSLAAVTAMSLCLDYPKWYVIAPAAVWALSVGYSRLYLGVHYPSDVAAGMVLGAGSALLTHYGQRWLDGRKKRSAPLVSGALLSYGYEGIVR